MKLETFKNGNLSDKRKIDIVIDKDFVNFYFNNDEDYFYSFLKKDWDNQMITHMERKNWFTEEMKQYINNQIKAK
jgi:hypothetical protein